MSDLHAALLTLAIVAVLIALFSLAVAVMACDEARALRRALYKTDANVIDLGETVVDLQAQVYVDRPIPFRLAERGGKR